MSRTTSALLSSVALLAAGCSSTPDSSFPASQELVDLATVTVNKMRQDPNNAGLNYHLEKARAVLVFPDVLKAGLVWGGAGGDGVLLTRTPGGTWSAPAFYSLGGITWGPQIGVQNLRAMVLLMNDQALQKVLEGGLTLGTAMSVAAGDAGGSKQANTRTSGSDSYYYLSESGAYAGATLNGAVLDEDRELAQEFYGKIVTSTQICLELAADDSRALPLKEALGR